MESHLQKELQNHTLTLKKDGEGYSVEWDGKILSQRIRSAHENVRSVAICMAINEELPYLRLNLAQFARHWMYQDVANVTQMLVWKLTTPFAVRVQNAVQNDALLPYRIHTRAYHQSLQEPAIGKLWRDWWAGVGVRLKLARPVFEPEDVLLNADMLPNLKAEQVLTTLMPFDVQKEMLSRYESVYRIAYQPERLKEIS